MRIDSDNLKRRLFWIIYHVCFRLYRWFPVFGSLRASLGIIQHEDRLRFLVIQRNDGRGVCLPGGISSRGEAEESAVCREVHEETGLEVSSISLAMKYHSSADVPCNICVFLVKASGELRHSWEGQPQWMTVEELEPHLLESQRPTLELMKKLAAGLPLE